MLEYPKQQCIGNSQKKNKNSKNAIDCICCILIFFNFSIFHGFITNKFYLFIYFKKILKKINKVIVI